MALVISKAAKLKPEICLGQALSEFESLINHEQKIQLHSFSSEIPDATAVMKLTSEIDRKNSNRRSRCIGSRLTNILESVQQFTTVIDVSIGSSQSNIAALTWGGVKLALLAANNFSSYFDKLSNLFMKIGRTCPRFSELAMLYPTKAITCSNRHSLAQAATSLLKPFEVEFGSFQKNLDSLGLEISEEVSLASKRAQIKESKSQELERRKNDSYRSLGLKFRHRTDQELGEAHQWRERKMKLAVWKALSTYNHQTAWKQARKQGTSTWVSTLDELNRWKLEKTSSTLWCTGILGSGKTGMTANLVEHLIVSGATKNVVGFFFCRYDEVESLKARTIIGSLARQLFDAVSTDVSVDKLCAFNDDLPLDVDQIVDFLREALPKDRQYFMVLDGLDECEEEEAKLLIANLQNLLTSADQVFKIYCSTRPDVFQWTNAMLAPRWHFSMSLANIGSEIADFIESTLEHCLELGTLRLGEPELIVAIQDALLEGAQGMFLWVAFQIPSICAQRNDEGILRTLRDLPKDLPETFDRVLRRIRQSKSTGSSHCQKIFKWIAATKRPLSTEELREAICLEPFQSAWNPRQLDNDITGTLASCGSLVMIDEEQLTVHFAHHSVKQHLLSTASDESFAIFHFDLAEADREVGAICVTYLSLGIFESQIAKTRHSNLNAADVPAVVVSGALPQNIVSKLAIRYLKNRQSVQSPVQRQLEDVAGVTESQRLQHIQQQFPFLQYARDYWLLHTKEAHIESRLSVMWRRLLESDDGVADKPWTKREMEHLPKRFVDWVVEHEHSALLERIIVGFVHTSGLGHNRLFRFTTVLETALQEKRKDFARKVILCNIPAQDIRDKLFFPIVRGGGDLDMLILNCKMGGNLDKTFTTEDQDTLFFLDRVTHWYFKDGTEFTLLELAAALGHSHIVKYVLFASPLQPVEIAFLVAAESEQREIMMMLIESHRIDPKWECRSWSALFYIARYGTLEMANRFIESIGNNLYPPWYHISHDGETADMVARRYRNIDVEKAILDVQDPWWKANWREVRMAPSKPGIKRHEVDKINKGFFEEGEFLKLENKWHYKKDRGGLIR